MCIEDVLVSLCGQGFKILHCYSYIQGTLNIGTWYKIYGDDDADIDLEEGGGGREERHVLVAAATHLLFTRTTCHCHRGEDHNDEDDGEDGDEGGDEDNGEDDGEDNHNPIWTRTTLFIPTCFGKEADSLLIKVILPASWSHQRQNGSEPNFQSWQ